MTIEYFYSNYQYKNNKLYLLNDKWTLERIQNNEPLQLVFNSLEIAQHFLESKQYKLVRVLVY